jgi:hypothetical protein
MQENIQVEKEIAVLQGAVETPSAERGDGHVGPLGSPLIGACDETMRNNSTQEFEAVAPSNDPPVAQEPIHHSLEIVETAFAELKDGTLVELMQDPENPDRTLLAVWKDGEVHYLDRLEQDDGYILMPVQRKNEIPRRLRLPTGVRPYQSMQQLLYRVEDFISQCVDVEGRYVPVLVDFVLSTWFVDRLSIALYLSIIGLPQSGKTTLLKVLSLVCRRPLLIADITAASFYRACTQFMPTMLIDEAGSVGNNRALRRILRTGTTRDVHAVMANRIVHSYGAKVICWLEPPDDPALNSRCILIPMCETTRTNLVNVDDPEVEREAAILQAQLLQFRFENYRRVKSNPIPGDERLRPRSRDLLRALSAAHFEDALRSKDLLGFFESGEAIPREPLNPAQNAVLRALFFLIHISGKDYDFIQTKDLTAEVNDLQEQAGERLRLQPRKVGAVLTSLGFSNRKRLNSGWVAYFGRDDARKIHQLSERYGIENLNETRLIVPRETCELCMAEKAKRPPTAKGYTSIPVDLRE